MNWKGGRDGLWRKKQFAIVKNSRLRQEGAERQMCGAVWAVVMSDWP